MNNENRFCKGYAEDAGVDIILDKDVIFPPFSTSIVDLNLNICPPEGAFAMLCPRTSAAKKGLMLCTSPIDANYAGTVHAIVYNISKNEIYYKKGESFCQSVMIECIIPRYLPVKKQGKRSNSVFGGTDK